MKTHRSTELFLYCSGGECTIKCVHLALEMEASKEEQRGVGHSWWVRVLEHTKFIVAKVHKWQERFCEGCTSSPVQAHQAITPDVIACTDGLIQENRRIKEKQIRVQVGISHGSMHAINKDYLQF